MAKRDLYVEVEERPQKPANVTVNAVNVISGPHSSSTVRSYLSRRVYPLRSCYQQRLRSNKGLQGTVRVRLSVDSSGRVTQMTFKYSSAGALTACVRATLRYLALPMTSSQASTVVDVTLSFRSGAGATRQAPIAEKQLPACGEPFDPPLSAAAVAALQTCYDVSLTSSPTMGGRLFVRVGGAKRGVVQSRGTVVDDTLALCIAQALETHDNSERSAICSVTLDNPASDPGVTEHARLEITLSDVKLNDMRVADTFRLEDDRYYVSAQNSILQGWRYLKDSAVARGVLTVRAHPGADATTVLRALAPLRKRGLDTVRFARAVGVTTTWAVVNGAGTPRYPECEPATASVRAHLAPEAITLSHAAGTQTIPAAGDAPDFEGFEKALWVLRNGPTAQRTDLVISASAGVHYRMLLRALAAPPAAGFVDVRVDDASSTK